MVFFVGRLFVVRPFGWVEGWRCVVSWMFGGLRVVGQGVTLRWIVCSFVCDGACYVEFKNHLLGSHLFGPCFRGHVLGCEVGWAGSFGKSLYQSFSCGNQMSL